MTSFVWLAILCSLVSAVFFAVGTQRQSVAVRSDPRLAHISPKSIVQLLRNPTWLLGMTLMGLGTVLNVLALTMAPIMVVQPLGCVALVLTTLINARDQGLSITKGTWVSVAVCTFGSVSFVLLAIRATHENPIDLGERWTVITVMAVVAVVFGGGAFLRRKASGGAFFYILGAGILFGLTAVLVRTVALAITRWDHDVPFWQQLPWAPLIAMAVAGLLGQYFNQHAYSSGPPELVIAGLTVIDPMVGVAVGITVLGELHPDVSALHAALMVLVGVIAIVGVVALARHHPDVVARREILDRSAETSD